MWVCRYMLFFVSPVLGAWLLLTLWAYHTAYTTSYGPLCGSTFSSCRKLLLLAYPKNQVQWGFYEVHCNPLTSRQCFVFVKSLHSKMFKNLKLVEQDWIYMSFLLCDWHVQVRQLNPILDTRISVCPSSVLLHAQTTSPGFWNGVDWRALVED